jgi:hypothetical protein
MSGHNHEAEGASLTLGTVFGPAPLTLTYQIAHRLSDDHAVTQLVLLSN